MRGSHTFPEPFQLSCGQLLRLPEDQPLHALSARRGGQGTDITKITLTCSWREVAAGQEFGQTELFVLAYELLDELVWCVTHFKQDRQHCQSSGGILVDDVHFQIERLACDRVLSRRMKMQLNRLKPLSQPVVDLDLQEPSFRSERYRNRLRKQHL